MKKYEIKVQHKKDAMHIDKVVVTITVPADEKADKFTDMVGILSDMTYPEERIQSQKDGKSQKVVFRNKKDRAAFLAVLSVLSVKIKHAYQWVVVYQTLVRGNYILPVTWLTFVCWLNEYLVVKKLRKQLKLSTVRKLKPYYCTTSMPWDERAAVKDMGEEYRAQFRKLDALRSEVMELLDKERENWN